MLTFMSLTLQDWVKDKLDRGFTDDQVKYVMNQTEFDKVDPDKVEFLMGKVYPKYIVIFFCFFDYLHA